MSGTGKSGRGARSTRTAAPPAAPFGSVPPQDLEAEVSTLGAILLAPDAIPEVAEVVQEDCFYRLEHQTLFRTIRDMYWNREPVDAVTVRARLEENGELERVGGAEYLGMIMARTPSPAFAARYARIVRDRATLRQLVAAAQQVLREAAEHSGGAEDLVGRFEQMIFSIAQQGRVGRARKLSDFLEETFDYIYRYHERRFLGLPTGLHDLDDALNGLQRGYFYVVAGRPSMGKTSLALRIVEEVALGAQPKPVLLCSLEMPGDVVARVMLCSHCRVSLDDLHKGRINKVQQKALLDESHRFDRAPIFIDESPDLTVHELRARGRRMKAEHGIELVVVDYLQLLHAPNAESRQLEIALISQGLKAMAKDLNVPVVALAQLNRAAEGREGHRPRLADLRESGAIEQDADVVMLLYREEYYNPDTENKNLAEVIIAKNRTGPTRDIKVAFYSSLMRFEALDRETLRQLAADSARSVPAPF